MPAVSIELKVTLPVRMPQTARNLTSEEIELDMWIETVREPFQNQRRYATTPGEKSIWACAPAHGVCVSRPSLGLALAGCHPRTPCPCGGNMNALYGSTEAVLARVEARLRRPVSVPASNPATGKLLNLVLMAVQSVPVESLHWVADAGAGLAWHARTLLATLTYCYACEVFGSEDIERAMGRDAEYRQLCANEFPDAKVLRRFRRFNRDALIHCLTNVLTGLQPPAGACERGSRFDVPFSSCPLTVYEAQRRVQTAILLDMQE
jgi:hypothetical protein